MFNIVVIKTILDVAESLLRMSEQLCSAGLQRRNEMSVLFEKIGNCLAKVSKEIGAGGVPHALCDELVEYAQGFPALLRKEVGNVPADELGDTLQSAFSMLCVAMDLRQVKDPQDKERYLALIDEASDRFHTLAKSVSLFGRN
ncbi:MAG TPA: hypothetical protein VEF34_11555 [Syntrophobacteraceae bacterium]|nr:hypothetical protein [Syntrophobacteraceae bacterium]